MMIGKKVYVTTVDAFLSGWGEAKGKKAVFVYICDSMDEAKIVLQNAKNRTDQREETIWEKSPIEELRSDPENRVAICTAETHPKWYEPGYF